MWLRWEEEVWLPVDLLLSSEGMADGRRLNLARIFAASSAAMPDQLPPESRGTGREASPTSLARSLVGWLGRTVQPGLTVPVSVCVDDCMCVCTSGCLRVVRVSLSVSRLLVSVSVCVLVLACVPFRSKPTGPDRCLLLSHAHGGMGHGDVHAERSAETELEWPRGRRSPAVAAVVAKAGAAATACTYGSGRICQPAVGLRETRETVGLGVAYSQNGLTRLTDCLTDCPRAWRFGLDNKAK